MDRLTTNFDGDDADASHHTLQSSAASKTVQSTSSATGSSRTETSSLKSAANPPQTSPSASSPLPSREPSPTRSLRQSIAAARNPAGPGARSRKNSYNDTSPSRSSTRNSSSISTSGPMQQQKNLLGASAPALNPPRPDSTARTILPSKSTPAALAIETQRDSPRWPVSPRLRSPPPILHKPNLGIPRNHHESQTPVISFQRSTPPMPSDPSHSDTETDENTSKPGTRTPVRGGNTNTSTLETVQEVSPLASPSLQGIDLALEKLQTRLVSDGSPQVDPVEYAATKSAKTAVSLSHNESASDNGPLNRSNLTSAPPPTLISRQSSTTNLARSVKNKVSEGTVKTMTVETETVTSIPQVSLAPSGPQGSSGSLRTKPSSETIRPKKDKKKPSRKQQTVQTSAGESFRPKMASSMASATCAPQLRHHESSRSRPGESQASVISLVRSVGGQGPPIDDVTSPRRSSAPAGTQSQSLAPLYIMNKLLTLQPNHSASSKADNFEAKIASAVDEADTSDSEETFVYDSNPPDARDRQQSHRFHSRTPSAASMVSQLAADRNAMRSIHGVIEGHTHAAGVVQKKKKFSNSYSNGGNNNSSSNGGNSSNNNLNSSHPHGSGPSADASPMLQHTNDDDGFLRGASSTQGSARGTTPRQPHHHFGVWGRTAGGNGHTYLFDNDSPFSSGPRPRISEAGGGSSISRHSPGPPSPRLANVSWARNSTGNSKRKHGGYGAMGIHDLDDSVSARTEDEHTSLLPTSSRSYRSRRGPRGYHHHQSLGGNNHHAHVPYRQHLHGHPPSLLNRMASCLVLMVMLLLVVSGAIGFMFATSQPLTNVELVNIVNVIASEQELMFDMTVKAQNPNVVVVVVDSSDLEIFAKSPHAAATELRLSQANSGSSSTTSIRPAKSRRAMTRIVPVPSKSGQAETLDDPADDQPSDDTAPNMRLGTILELDQPFSFEGSFFDKGASVSTGGLRLKRPGNGTEGGPERWERIVKDEFDLILKGVLKYTLPLSQRVRTIAIAGRTKVKPNSANNPSADPQKPN